MSFIQIATALDALDLGRKQDFGYLSAMLPLRLARDLWEHRRRQRSYQHLLELPDYLLEDAGLTRPQIIEMMRRRPL